MKTIFIFSAYMLQVCFFMMCLSSSAIAQEIVREQTRGLRSSEFQEKLPVKYRGGDEGMMQFIGQNASYPKLAKDNKIQGVVKIRFLASVFGVDSAFVVQSVHPLLDQEAVRVVRLLKDWVGSASCATRVWYTIPLNFRCDNNDKDSIYIHPEYKPYIRGLRPFVEENMAYKGKLKCSVKVSFVVSSSGSLRGICVENQVDPEVDAEAIRLVSDMPRWIPAVDHGRLVDALFTITIDFNKP